MILCQKPSVIGFDIVIVSDSRNNHVGIDCANINKHFPVSCLDTIYVGGVGISFLVGAGGQVCQILINNGAQHIHFQSCVYGCTLLY